MQFLLFLTLKILIKMEEKTIAFKKHSSNGWQS